MKDAYRNTMDAIKAPDALVEKTLQAMLKEHKRLEMGRQGHTSPKEMKAQEVQPLPHKLSWIARIALPAVACLCLCLAVIVPRLPTREADVQTTPGVDSRYSPSPETLMPDAMENAVTIQSDEPTASKIHGVAADHLATRSGPATAYRETGTYPIKGETVRLISRAYDENGLCWVQCEVFYGSKLRRVYTGVQRLDEASFDLASVVQEVPLEEQAKIITTTKAMYGPGDGYDSYAELTLDKGQVVAVIAVENGYAQVEWITALQSYRAWVPVQAFGIVE